MKHAAIKFASLALLVFTAQVHAITPDDMMAAAIRNGEASGELTGELAEGIKVMTHSNEPTQAAITQMSIDADKCRIFHFTVTQPKIPNRRGDIVGDYVTVSRSKICPDDRKQATPEVIDCRIGKDSCMPAKAPAAVKRP